MEMFALAKFRLFLFNTREAEPLPGVWMLKYMEVPILSGTAFSHLDPRLLGNFSKRVGKLHR